MLLLVPASPVFEGNHAEILLLYLLFVLGNDILMLEILLFYGFHLDEYHLELILEFLLDDLDQLLAIGVQVALHLDLVLPHLVGVVLVVGFDLLLEVEDSDFIVKFIPRVNA